MAALCRSVNDWIRREDGALTVEASLVFPWMLIMTFLLILSSLVIADRTLLYYASSAAGERAAFSWAHSKGDFRTGAYPAGEYDGLYWRLTDDAMLSGLFGWTLDSGDVRVPLGGARKQEGNLTEGKLGKAANLLSDEAEGYIAYKNRVWKREIAVAASGGEMPAPLRRLWGAAGSQADAASVTAVVTEPAEWIRTFELIRYYRAKMKTKGQGAEEYWKRTAAVLGDRR